MSRLPLIAALLAVQATALCANTPAVPVTAREAVEWCDIWISHANETNLPRVLLIGDSITRDYYPGVEKRLASRALVARLTSSAFLSDPMLRQQLEMVLGAMKFDVIHFNNGMHGWQHSEAEYAEAFPALLQTLHRCAPSAKLIWANITPLKVSPVHAGPQEATNGRIIARNIIAGKLVQAEGMPVDDLYSLAAGHPEFHSDNVHFSPEGVALQAAKVAAAIDLALKK